MKIAILYTDLAAKNNSYEELSIIQDAQEVQLTLNSIGHQSTLVPFCLKDLSRTFLALQDLKPEVVFNLVDEVDGVFELSHLPASLLSAWGYRYTGCRETALTITTDKILAKEILKQNNLPTAPWLCYENLSLPKFTEEKFLVKHRYLDASVGLDEATIKLYDDGPELRKILADNRCLMAEIYIDGREFALPIFNHQGQIFAPGAAETIFTNYPADKLKIIGTNSKWKQDSFEYNNTIANFEFEASDSALITELKSITRSCWDLLHLSSYARVDFRVDLQGRPWVLEVNGNPSIAGNDWLACVAEEAGVSYAEVLQSIIQSAS